MAKRRRNEKDHELCATHREVEAKFFFLGGGFNFVFTGVDMPPQLVWV
jgi:hypothetical protein